ncbi:MAG: NAD(P)-dependent glycerol-3-phosphate dehydrogenase [Dehalococcoidales bacterium]|nr:NAD(P)-dependent glycerol-3-phosphate dehydrogenase [Dehalococcoidales bacterium]
MPQIAVIGTTAWGATLGAIWAENGLHVSLWARTEEEAIELRGAGPKIPRLDGIKFPSRLSVTNSLKQALSGAEAVILAVPAQTIRHNIRLIAGYLGESMLVLSTAKGLEIGSNKRMTEVIAEEISPEFHSNICVLSGPNLSKEILRGLPAATVVAAESETVCRTAQKLLTTPNLCVYHNTDVIGVELGGALKNVIALAAGIADGLGYGDNAKATLVTRGLAEITAFGVALGANPLTFSGLAGLGDLMATCASPLSRNHYVGVELTKGRSLEEIVGLMTGVAEGVSTTIAAWELARQLGVEMPITEGMYRVLYQGADPREEALALMGAQARHELAGRRWKLFSLFRHKTHSRSEQPAS